jgi:hypothetical protein
MKRAKEIEIERGRGENNAKQVLVQEKYYILNIDLSRGVE